MFVIVPNLKEKFLSSAGNSYLHNLTSTTSYQLRVDMGDFDGETRYAEYGSFSVGSAADKYELHVSNYSGDAGKSYKT